MAVRIHSGPIHHGLIVIDVPSSTATHEGWDPNAGPVHAAPGSVYVPMIPSVDGPITVSILSQESVDDSRSDLVPVFDGNIGLPNEDLRITDADEVVHIIVPAAERESSRVKLSVDDAVYPSVLEVIVG
jgi:hypothetical protein